MLIKSVFPSPLKSGAGLDTVAAVLVHHELAKYDPGFTLAYLALAMLFVNNFYHCSNAEQRARYLPNVLSGEWVAGMGMTEPGAGTDVLAMTTTAVRDGDDYVLNGTKTYITNGVEGFCFLVYAKVDGRITAFVVDRTCPGFTTSNHIDKLGMRGSTMSELIFTDCRVPATNLLGAVGSGMTHMMRNLEIQRVTLAAMSVGIAERCVEIMVRYAHDRQAFRTSLNRFGQSQRYIGDGYAMTAGPLGPSSTRSPTRSAPRSATASAPTPPSCSAPPSANRSPTTPSRSWAAPATARNTPSNACGASAKLLEIGGGTLEAHQKNLTKDLTALLLGQASSVV